MDYKEELKRLVEIVKNKAKARGERMTNEQLAAKFGVKRTYLSDLLGSHGEVTQKHVALFKEKFKSDLSDVQQPPPFEKDDPLNWERAAIKSLSWGLANALAKISALEGKPRDPESYLEEIDRSTNMILADLRRSKDKAQ